MNNVAVVAGLLPAASVASGHALLGDRLAAAVPAITYLAAEKADCSVPEKPPIGSPSFVRSGSQRGLVPVSQEGLTFVGISRMLVSGWVKTKGVLVETDGCSHAVPAPPFPRDYTQQPPGSVAPTPPVSGSESRFCRQLPPPHPHCRHWALVASISTFFYWLRYGCGFVASHPHLLAFQLFHHRWKKLPAMISFLKIFAVFILSWLVLSETCVHLKPTD